MNVSNRIMYNTIALYIKMLLTTIISLYLTRVVLKQLGAEDFGIYNLIGGVVVLLSFLQTALSISTQRFLSVAMAKKEQEQVRNIFTTGFFIHLLFAGIIILIFEICNFFIFDGFLNISEGRLPAAKIVYQLMVCSTVISVITVPFNSLITAHEDIWYFSITEIISVFIKLAIVILFHYVNMDSLILYSIWILFAIFAGAILKYLWCFIRYKECTLKNKLSRENISIAKEMLGFTGWNAFGSIALIGRNQGVSILINIFYGTTINAVYGIANQVNGQLIHISQIMTQAMTPQIAKSYGVGDFNRMKRLSFFASKMAFFLYAVFALPLIIELSEVLYFWLGNDVPEYTHIYIILCLIMFLLMELYPGITRAIQATGKIRKYQVCTSFLLLIPLPLGYVLYSMGRSNETILYLMIISQILQLIYATYYGYKVNVLDLNKYIIYIIKSIIIFIILLSGGLYLKNQLIGITSSINIFIIMVVLSMSIFTFLYYALIFDRNEKSIIKSSIFSVIKKKKTK